MTTPQRLKPERLQFVGPEKQLKRPTTPLNAPSAYAATDLGIDNVLGSDDDVTSLRSRTEHAPEDYDDFFDKFDKMGADHVTHSHDSLNSQLDNLLLFATLFSAINSAFLVFSLPTLGNPAVQTNDILLLLVEVFGNTTLDGKAQAITSSPTFPDLDLAINALFSTSLICSLITAFFAAVGKQWLTHYSKKEIGSMEQMRKNLQSKIIGAKHYHLHAILDGVLMTIVEVALLLFILGFILFLVTINMTLAYIVIAFAIVGLLFYLVSVGLALWDPHCPYQTPVTITIVPWLCCSVYRIISTFIALLVFLKLLFILSIGPLLGHHTEEVSRQVTDLDTAFGTRISKLIPQKRGYDFEPEWDIYYQKRHQFAEYFKRAPTEVHFTVETACWVIETTKEEGFARCAAATFLLLSDRNLLTVVGQTRGTVRRLRKLIRLAEEDLEEEEGRIARTAEDLEELKGKEWERLSFYVHVLSHIFAGMLNADSALYDSMDKIYLYQTMRARKDNRQHSHTVVPARMVGVIKLLLSKAAHIDLHLGDPERERTLRSRLYACVTEGDCTAKALSLTAFAMTTLPHWQPAHDDKSHADDKTLSSAVRAVRNLGAWSQTPHDQNPLMRSPTSTDIHEMLWHTYTKGDLSDVCRNIIGALKTYTKYRAEPTPPPALPTETQFLGFLQRVKTHIEKYQPAMLSTATRKFFIEACADLLRSLWNNAATLLYETTLELLCLSVEQVTRKMAVKAPGEADLVIVCEWCPLLVKLHLDLSGHGEMLGRAHAILQLCKKALDGRKSIIGLSRPFVSLVAATGRVVLAEESLDEYVQSTREVFIEEGIAFLGDMLKVFDPAQFEDHRSIALAFSSPEVGAAMLRFLQRAPPCLETPQTVMLLFYRALLAEWSSRGELLEPLEKCIKDHLAAASAAGEIYQLRRSGPGLGLRSAVLGLDAEREWENLSARLVQGIAVFGPSGDQARVIIGAVSVHDSDFPAKEEESQYQVSPISKLIGSPFIIRRLQGDKPLHTPPHTSTITALQLSMTMFDPNTKHQPEPWGKDMEQVVYTREDRTPLRRPEFELFCKFCEHCADADLKLAMELCTPDGFAEWSEGVILEDPQKVKPAAT